MKLAVFCSIVKGLARGFFFRKKVPLSISWALTYRCNLSCKYCGYWQEKTDELSTEQIFKILDEMSDIGVRLISFTGGEPLIRDDIGLIIKRAKSKELLVNLNTNGMLLLNRLEDIKEVDSIQVSLDGDELANDAIRGTGVYKQVLSSLTLLRKNNIKLKIQTVISNFNLDSIDYICKLSRDLKVPVGFQPATEYLLGSKLINPCIPEKAKYTDAIKNIIVKKRQGYRIFNSFVGLKHLSYFPSKKKIQCMAGLLCYDVEPDGKMLACDRYPYYQQQEDILKVGFKNAFNSLKPVSCEYCWCASQVEFNYIASFNINVLLNMLKNNYF